MTEVSDSSKVPCVEAELLKRARSGDREAFDRLFFEHIPKLRSVLHRMVGHPDDVDELSQQALLQAFEGLGTFRGESAASTWLCSIGARLALDHLRRRKRWRTRAQTILAHRALEEEALGEEIGAAISQPDFSYDVNEHIAYCFTCVGRSLEPELQAALVLRDVLELKNEEAARALEMSVSTFRHRHRAARAQMEEVFSGLCALVNKQGVCWQCAGLREVAPEGKKGPDVPTSIDFEGRLHLVRQAALKAPQSQAMHHAFFRATEIQENRCLGDESMSTDCGTPKAATDGP